MPRPLVVAHRGGGALAPENTLAAIGTAVRLGADAVELDVQPSRDGHLMVHHDETLARTAGLARAVWDLELRELQRLDAGGWFGPAFHGERVPTLEEAAAALPAGVRLVVDLKHGDERFPGLARRLADFARAFGPARLSVLSIRHAFATAVADAAPGVLPLFTYRAAPAGADELAALHALPAHVGFAAAMRALSLAMLAIAAADGRAVYVFTPNTEAELRTALGAGVDAVITDRPDLALDLRRRLAS